MHQTALSVDVVCCFARLRDFLFSSIDLEMLFVSYHTSISGGYSGESVGRGTIRAYFAITTKTNDNTPYTCPNM